MRIETIGAVALLCAAAAPASVAAADNAYKGPYVS